MLKSLIQSIRKKPSNFQASQKDITIPQENIFDAIIRNDCEKVRVLVHQGVLVDAPKADGVTPLILAASLDLIDMVKTLLELGADPNIATPDGWIAYDFAHNKGNIDITDILRAHDRKSPSINCPDRISQDLDVFLDNSDLILPKRGFDDFNQRVKEALNPTEIHQLEEQLQKTNYRTLLKHLYTVEAASCSHFANNNFLSMRSPMSLGSYDVAMAKRRNIDLVEFYENKFAITDKLLHELLPDNIFTQAPTHICEIGGAWGATIKHLMSRFPVVEYQNYEPDTAYANWVAERFGAKKMPVDGETLSGTEDDSMDLVLANNVFIFVPVIKIWSYLTEIRRVIKKNGIIFFNAVVSDQRTEADLRRYLDCYFPKRSICILPRDIIDRTFPEDQFEVLSVFDREYFIIKRKA